MSASILKLPFDIVEGIVGYLTIKEYFDLSQVNRKFREDLKHDGTARKCLQSNLPCSAKAKTEIRQSDASGSRNYLNIVHSRSEALRNASPYSATILARATSFVFNGGIVCYSTASTDSHEIRVLDFRHLARTEKVIDSRYLAQRVANPGESISFDLRSLSITGFKHHIVTVVCDFGPAKGSYLFAINIAERPGAKRALLCERLRSTNKIFVIHDAKYLYYGTHSATGSDGYREWLIQGFDLSSSKALTQRPLQLCNFAGSDAHSVVDFTIQNGAFYAISNQTSFESEEINWTSYYCYVTFPVDAIDPDVTLKTIWRRQDEEGPINDSWTRLFFQTDETTGELLVVEVRKEWPKGASHQRRTCYMQPWTTALHGDWDQRASTNTADRLSLAIEKDDKPRYEADTPPRINKYRHFEFGPGFEGEKHEYINSKTKWSHYSYADNAFVDLVVDDIEVTDSWRPKERIRLRVASRSHRSPVESLSGSSCLLNRVYHHNMLIEGSEETFGKSWVSKWPSAGVQLPEELEDMMCPGGKAGEVKAVLEDRGIIYMAGAADADGQRSLFYLSFDPTFGFEGMRKLDSSLAMPRQESRRHNVTTGRKRTSASSMSGIDIDSGPAQAKRAKIGYDGPAALQVEEQTATPSLVTSEKDHSQPAVPHSPPSNAGVDQQQATGQIMRERLFYKTQATYLRLQQGWWLR